MKSLFSLFFCICIGNGAFASEELYPERSDYEIISKVEDSGLKVGRTKVIFQLSGFDYVSSKKIVWSANKMIDTVFLGDRNEISEVLISGKYNFKFYHNSTYKEIIIPRLELESGYCYTIAINFKLADRENMQVKKPVIYLYPEVSMMVEVKIKPKGELAFTYPSYDNGWQVLAEPNGDLFVCYQKLNYLFWESEQEYDSKQIEFTCGSIVEKSEIVSFLEQSLTAYGLNSKEQADFITFWGPILQQNNQNFIHFIFNEDADQFATLDINPKPNHVNRIYILYMDSQEMEISDLKAQEIPRMDREGFSVLEWGGSEINLDLDL